MKGHSEEDAIVQISKIQVRNSNNRTIKFSKLKNVDLKAWKEEFNMYTEYYEKRGFSPEEAKIKVKNRQTTFSLEKCIERYGEVEGCVRWFARQEKWQHSLSLRTDDEKLESKKRQIVPLGRASRESLAIFEPLKDLLISKCLLDSDIYYGFEDRKEWFLADKDNFYLYDFCIPKLKLIIEYQGFVWHPDHRLSSDEIKLWKSARGVSGINTQISDGKKRKFAEDKGFRVVYLWGKDDPSENMKIAFDAIKFEFSNSFTTKISQIEEFMKFSDVKIETPYGFDHVSNFFTKIDKRMVHLLFSNGEHLKCSDDHYLFTDSKNWISAGELFNLRFNSLLPRIKAKSGVVDIISIQLIENGIVNDITVDNDMHWYYTNGLVSHNSGKTLLSIAAGLQQLRMADGEGIYEKLVVTRPIQTVGKDLGFLPGTLEEKLDPWISPIKDNINYLVKNKSRQRKSQQKDQKDTFLSMLLDRGLLEIEAIAYIRGRSISNSFIIVDEAQNLSVHELKTIVTRVGEGTKVVLTGDIEQIDNLDVDFRTNALTYAIERFRDQLVAGHVTLLKGERSALASLAARIL